MCKIAFIVQPNDKFRGAAVDGEVVGNIFTGMAIVERDTVVDGECSVVDLARKFSWIRKIAGENDGIDNLMRMVNVMA